jgi:hypothetical protein
MALTRIWHHWDLLEKYMIPSASNENPKMTSKWVRIEYIRIKLSCASFWSTKTNFKSL